jgi:hypothetical protein
MIKAFSSIAVFNPLNGLPSTEIPEEIRKGRIGNVTQGSTDVLSQCTNETQRLHLELDAYYPTMPSMDELCIGQHVRGGKAYCDFSSVYQYDFKQKCKELGGVLMGQNFEMCPPLSSNLYPLSQPKHFYFMNYPQCAAKSCGDVTYFKSIEKAKRIMGYHCPDQNKNDMFALKIKGEGKVITKSCDWLQRQHYPTRKRICFKKEHQLYINGHLPASRICPKSCKPTPSMTTLKDPSSSSSLSFLSHEKKFCIDEHANAQFIVDKYVGPLSGIENVVIRDCKWLATKSESERNAYCAHAMNLMTSKLDSKYGTAVEVCTKSCNTCSRGSSNDND